MLQAKSDEAFDCGRLLCDCAKVRSALGVAHVCPEHASIREFATEYLTSDCLLICQFDLLPQGFIMGCGPAENCTVRICSLDPAQRLDTPWPIARLQQRATPTALGYYAEAQLHIVAVSRQVHLDLIIQI